MIAPALAEIVPQLLGAIFLEPIPISGSQRLLAFLPLAASVSLVYKTLRCRSMSEVPAASAVLWITIVLGMFGLGVALFVAFRLLQ